MLEIDTGTADVARLELLAEKNVPVSQHPEQRAVARLRRELKAAARAVAEQTPFMLDAFINADPGFRHARNA